MWLLQLPSCKQNLLKIFDLATFYETFDTFFSVNSVIYTYAYNRDSLFEVFRFENRFENGSLKTRRFSEVFFCIYISL